MVEKKLSYKIDYVTNFKESGFDSLMKKQVQLQQSIVSTNKIATRLASGKGRVTGQDLADSQTFLSSKMTDFQKQNLSYLAAIEVNTRSSFVSKNTSKSKSQSSMMERLFGDIENRKTKGILRTKTNIFQPTGATSIGGVLTSLLTTINPLIVVAIGLMTAIFAVIVSSSRMLQRTLGNIMKFIMMFVRPIGDMLAVLLYPLMMVLRPLALMVNTLVRPFLMEARRSFRLSLQLSKEAGQARDLGMYEAAGKLDTLSADMFSTGIATLAMGLGKLVVNLFGEAIKLNARILIEAISLPLGILAGAIDALTGGATNLSGGLQNAKQMAIDFVNTGVDGALKVLNDSADSFLETVRAKNDAVNTLVSYTGNWLDKVEQFPTDSTLFQNVSQSIIDLVSDIEAANLAPSVEAYNAAEDKIKSTGETMTKVIDDIYEKKKLLDENIPGAGGGGGGGAGGGESPDFLSSIMGIFTNMFTDLVSPIDEVQKLLSGDFAGAITDFVAGPWDEIYTAVVDMNTLFGELQQATMDLHGEGGHGFVELQEEVSKNITTMGIFSNAVVSTISAIDSAVSRAQYFANQAISAAASAARAASSARSSANSSKGSKAIGGSIDQNGMYYLHRGETVTNPVDSSFKNTSGGSGGGNITINMQGSTFGNFNEWKREMDKYFSQQMRHMR